MNDIFLGNDSTLTSVPTRSNQDLQNPLKEHLIKLRSFRSCDDDRTASIDLNLGGSNAATIIGRMLENIKAGITLRPKTRNTPSRIIDGLSINLSENIKDAPTNILSIDT